MTNVPIERAELAGIAVKASGWSFFIGALGFATGSIAAGLSLVTTVYFPREALPISTVLTQSSRSHSRGNAPCNRARMSLRSSVTGQRNGHVELSYGRRHCAAGCLT
jgi:hypothetical protein